MSSPLPGKIVEEYREGNNRLGLIEFGGKRRPIYLDLVPEAHIGDYVRFRAGFATERVAEEQIQDDGERPGASAAEGQQPNFETYRAHRLLSELDPQQLRKLLPLAQEQQFVPGQIVFRSGDKSSSLHLIVSGDVALEEVTGEPIAVQTLRAGDAMGWSALTGDGRTHFQARAISPLSTVAFPGEQLREACERDPAMGYALMKRLIELVSERMDAMRLKLDGRGKSKSIGASSV
jgi:CRP/FNR family transcriptional regulator, cyclic AMP receptor protein